MSFWKKLAGIAAPIIGSFFGPVGTVLGGAIGGGISGGGKGALMGGLLGGLSMGVGSALAATPAGQAFNQGFQNLFGAAEAGAGAGAGGFGLDYAVTPGGVVDSAGNAFSGGMADLGGMSSGAMTFNNPDFVAIPGGGSPGTGTFNNPDFVHIPYSGGAGMSAEGAAGWGGGAVDFGGMGREQPQSFMSSMSLGNFGGPQGWGIPAGRTLAGLYGLIESERLKKMMQLPDPSVVPNMPGYQAGLEAVRRTMASQGYQGSGNMMLALQKYGGDMYNQYVGQRMASGQGQAGATSGGLSSLALLSNGLSGLGGAYGW